MSLTQTHFSHPFHFLVSPTRVYHSNLTQHSLRFALEQVPLVVPTLSDPEALKKDISRQGIFLNGVRCSVHLKSHTIKHAFLSFCTFLDEHISACQAKRDVLSPTLSDGSPYPPSPGLYVVFERGVRARSARILHLTLFRKSLEHKKQPTTTLYFGKALEDNETQLSFARTQVPSIPRNS